MARWITAELRQSIADRANQLCEYCLIAEADTFYGCQVDTSSVKNTAALRNLITLLMLALPATGLKEVM